MLPNKQQSGIRSILLSTLFLCLCSGLAFSQDSTDTATDNGGEATAQVDQAVLDAGKSLYENNCAQCHSLYEEKVVGPGFAGVFERTPGEEWMKQWIINSQALIQDGDEYAVNIFNEYNQQVMPNFKLTDDEFASLFAYMKNPPAPVTAQESYPTGEGKNVVTGDPALGNYFNVLLGVLILVLVLIIGVLVLMLSVLQRYLKQRDDLTEDDKEIVNQKYNIAKIFQNRAFIGGVTLIFALVVLKAVLDGLLGVGIQQGYAPTQPIPFSHKLHAGMYNIECAYCHTGVYKGKSAVIPSANICMNCHNAIKQASPHIQKIYKAIENDRPIEWVRVHNLPDLVNFNHAQHTNVAGLECQQCHGEIEQMEVVQQRSPLTMGWCINCHRQTIAEHAKDNDYYNKLLEYHEEAGKGPITVEKLGGLECSKCHY